MMTFSIGRGESFGSLPKFVPLPCDNAKIWAEINKLKDDGRISGFDGLAQRMAIYGGPRRLNGLQNALTVMEQGIAREAGAVSRFFDMTLPYIIDLALQLPELRKRLDGHELPFLRQGERTQVAIDRMLVASLIANMFLCTFDEVMHKVKQTGVLPMASFAALFSRNQNSAPQEIAKIAMFVHFFERLATQAKQGGEPIRGQIVIDRVVGVSMNWQQWQASKQPLLPLDMAPMKVGFEDELEGLAHADFANMYIGGGVLSGGCVQEEIRFSICPELLLACLCCPVMQPDEALQILGGEQFSKYKGYAFGLQYGGDHQDGNKPFEDGTVSVNVLAMDAQDFRHADASLGAQLVTERVLRDLNKAVAAFTPVDDLSLQRFHRVATGNWGCGAFRGCAQLKAIMQWASASQCRRSLRYYPFDESFGEELKEMSHNIAACGATVGDLVRVIGEMRGSHSLDPARMFSFVKDRITKVGSSEEVPEFSTTDVEWEEALAGATSSVPGP